ncbi:MAG: DUF86 domain-containing protein [Candidatus Heimdallarchaeota archaeon]|nr:DUF86 domain-containing protein [Candidatus Heimdallarchaeota archaeon]
MIRDHTIFLKDILVAIDAIADFIGDMDFESFKDDDKTSSAVIRKLEIIGEAIKNIPDEIKVKHFNVPWKDIAGMRDRLIHAYFGVDYKLVWETIKTKLSSLVTTIQIILAD